MSLFVGPTHLWISLARAYVRVHAHWREGWLFATLRYLGGDADSGAFPRVFTLR
jgi:hypothetical protein